MMVDDDQCGLLIGFGRLMVVFLWFAGIFPVNLLG